VALPSRFRELRAEDYIEMCNHGVEPRLIGELKQAGYQRCATMGGRPSFSGDSAMTAWHDFSRPNDFA
jgi:hypothetical protein